MKRLFSIGFLSLLMLMAPMAWGASEWRLPVKHLKIAHDSVTLFLSLQLAVGDPAVKSDQERLYTPVLRSGDEALELPTLCVAGRNRYYRHLRKSDNGGGMQLYRAGKQRDISYQVSVPLEKWMLNAHLYLRDDVCGCLDEVLAGDRQLLSVLHLEPRTFCPQYVFRIPKLEEKRRQVSGSAYIDFPVNISVIHEDFRNNPVELRKILATIDSVKTDTDYQIRHISIKGYASPEGSYANNRRLARERTAALKAYVQQLYHFADGLLQTEYEPEDWEGFRRLVETTPLVRQQEILDWVVREDLDRDRQEQQIRQKFPQDYRMIKTLIYPRLRHSDYCIAYTVRAYTDVEEAKRVMKEAPGKLSPYEFYKIAETYPTGSEAYNEVFNTMAWVYPKNELANLNAANVAMARGDLKAASDFLKKAGEGVEADYANGVLEALQRNFEKAQMWFVKAKEGGLAEAEAALLQLETLMAEEASLEMND